MRAGGGGFLEEWRKLCVDVLLLMAFTEKGVDLSLYICLGEGRSNMFQLV